MARALGKTPAELAGLKCYEHMHGASCPPDFCPHAKLLADGREHNAEVHELGRDFLVTASPLTDDRGRTIGSVHVARDITERKRAEEALRNSNKRTTDILESISDGFFSCDQEMVVTYFNSAAARILGRDGAEVLGRKLFDAFPEARGSIFEEKYSEALREGRFISFETYFEPEAYRNWYEVRVYPFEEGISVYFQVTTERKRAERALRESQRDLNRAQAVARTGSWRLDVRRNELLWSDETYRIFGIPQGTSLTYEAFLAAIHPEDREYVDQHGPRPWRASPMISSTASWWATR